MTKQVYKCTRPVKCDDWGTNMCEGCQYKQPIKQEPQIMICPKAKECKHSQYAGSFMHRHCGEHKKNEVCKVTREHFNDVTCPVCILYIPEQPKKPATHEGSARWWDDPADLQPEKHCTKCGKGQIVLHGLCQECILTFEAPQMPAISEDVKG